MDPPMDPWANDPMDQPQPDEVVDTDDEAEGWWFICGTELLEALERAYNGDPPGIVYAELYANSEQHSIADDG